VLPKNSAFLVLLKKKSDCSAGTTKKMGLLHWHHRNWIALLALLKKKISCSASASEKKNQTVPLVPLEKLDCSTGAAEKNRLLCQCCWKEIGLLCRRHRKKVKTALPTTHIYQCSSMYVPAGNLIFNFKNWLACTDYGTCLKDQWAQQWNWCKVWVIFNFHNLKWLACTDYGTCLNDQCRCKYFASVGANLLHSSTTILDRSNFTVTTIFNFHKLKKWVVCAHFGTPMKDRWAQHWDQCPSVLQAGAAIFNSSNFIVTTVFNFYNLKKWAACTAILNRLNFVVTPIFNFHNLKKWVGGTCLRDRWAQQWDQHPSVLQAGTAILNSSNLIVTTVFNFHNL